MNGLLPTTSQFQGDLSDEVEKRGLAIFFDKRAPILELHYAKKRKIKCMRFEHLKDGWHSWNISCTNKHLTTIHPECPMGLN